MGFLSSKRVINKVLIGAEGERDTILLNHAVPLP